MSTPVAVADSLFDELDRTDWSACRDTEDSFSFLNRAASPFWGRIRVELAAWFQDYPAEARNDLRRRFQDAKPAQHYAAWWELYQHRLWRRAGFDVAVHPTLANGARPDLVVTGETGSFYVEALTIMSSLGSADTGGALKAEIYEAINSVNAPNFWVSVSWEQVGSSAPPKRAFTKQIEGWLRKLDADGLADVPPGNWPRTTVTVGEWVLSLKALPIDRERRGKPTDRLIGIGPATAAYMNDGALLQKAIEQPRKRAQRKTADRPVVIAALLLNGMVKDDLIAEALFGDEWGRLDRVQAPGGLWAGPRGVTNRRVSAVLVGHGILHHNFAQQAPRLWHHYAPYHPLNADLPFATARLVDDEIRYADAQQAPHDLFGLPEEWPGPDPPFG